VSDPPIQYARASDRATLGFVVVGDGTPLVWVTAAGMAQAQLTERKYRALIEEHLSGYRLVVMDGRPSRRMETSAAPASQAFDLFGLFE